MEMALLAASAVPSINLFVPTYADFFCFCDYIALDGHALLACAIRFSSLTGVKEKEIELQIYWTI